MKPRYDFAKTEGRKFYNSTCNGLRYPINLLMLAHALKIGIENTNIIDEDGYTMRRERDNKYKIVINYDTQGLRKRFTLAHEIGHIMLKHFEHYDVDNLDDKSLKVLDKEADVFAAEILMPYRIIKRMRPNIKEMASYFEVTEYAMETRLSILGIVPSLDLRTNVVAERSVFKYSLMQVDDDMMKQLNMLHDKWLYDF